MKKQNTAIVMITMEEVVLMAWIVCMGRWSTRCSVIGHRIEQCKLDKECKQNTSSKPPNKHRKHPSVHAVHASFFTKLGDAKAESIIYLRLLTGNGALKTHSGSGPPIGYKSSYSDSDSYSDSYLLQINQI
jgi:hypothetical protein